jgi:hypothetical protein
MVRNEMRFITKPLVPMKGLPVKGPPGSSRVPLNATQELYQNIKHMAHVNAEELAAILCGYWPFEIEEMDDQSVIAGYCRVLVAVEEAIRAGVLAKCPTLRAGTLWAIEAGLPFINQDQLRNAVSVPDSPKSAEPTTFRASRQTAKRDRKDPAVQAMADRIRQEDERLGKRRKKPEVAEIIIKETNCNDSIDVVMSKFNYSGRER